MDGVFGAAAVGVGRACCRQRGYGAGVGEKIGQEPFFGPKRVVNDVRRPRQRVNARVVFVVHSET